SIGVCSRALISGNWLRSRLWIEAANLSHRLPQNGAETAVGDSWCCHAANRRGHSRHHRGLAKQHILRLRLQAADELPRRPNVNEPPRAVLRIHGIFVSLSHEVQRADLRLGQIVEAGGETSHFAVIPLDASRGLAATPNHFLFFFALAFGRDVWSSQSGRD